MKADMAERGLLLNRLEADRLGAQRIIDLDAWAERERLRLARWDYRSQADEQAAVDYERRQRSQ